MTVEIRITTNDPSAYGSEREQIDNALDALGFARLNATTSLTPATRQTASPPLTAIQQSVENGAFSVRIATDEERAAVGIDTPARVRGQPAPGKARRTKVEIAEDEAAGVSGASTGAISSSPENRVGPEDDAETVAQDAADEAAEVEENRAAEEPLTVDDLRQAVGRYNTAFGMEATIANINGIIGCKQSDVPATQEALSAAVAKVDAAIAAGSEPTKPAEKIKELTVDDVFAVVKQFVEKFGGPAAERDGPSIFEAALGKPPEGERFWKKSILPTDQKSLKACVDGWSDALAGLAG